MEEPDEAEIGLLLLTLRDFWHGHAALGGETSNGRGTLQGIKACLKFKRATASSTEVWEVLDKNKRMTIEEGIPHFLNLASKKPKTMLTALQVHRNLIKRRRYPMVKNEHAELNEELVCKHRCDVTDTDAAWILLQEPGFIGFGAVYKDKICWPKHAEPLDWTRVRDLRLFGEKGEWHVGRIGREVGKAVCENWRILTTLLQNIMCYGEVGLQNLINRLG